MFTPDNLFTLFFLILLQVVLGFDNLLYISLESKKAPEDKRVLVRRWGIGLAIFLRLILLFIIMSLVDSIQGVLFSINIMWLKAPPCVTTVTYLIDHLLISFEL